VIAELSGTERLRERGEVGAVEGGALAPFLPLEVAPVEDGDAQAATSWDSRNTPSRSSTSASEVSDMSSARNWAAPAAPFR
jgi:hypothetical protein